MSNSKCPMCGANVSVASNAKEGDLVYCDACDAELEIVSLKPLELDWPLDDYEEFEEDDYFEEEEDYEYDYDEEYDD